MHSLAFHISSSLSERAHYRRNLALTLSQPALLCSVFTLAQNVSSLKASVLPSPCWEEGEGGRETEREGRRRKMEKSGEKKANVATHWKAGERGRRGRWHGWKERGQAVCQREGGRRRLSMAENPVFSMTCSVCYRALFTTYSIISSSLPLEVLVLEYSRANHHVIHSVSSDLWLGIPHFSLHL